MFRHPGQRTSAISLWAACLLAAVYGLKTGVRPGLTGPAVLALVAGLAGGALFVRRQRSAASPLLDLRLFRYRIFTAAVGILLAAGAVTGGIGFPFAQYLQLAAGLPPLPAGLWSLPDPAAMIACSLLCPLAVRRVRPAFVIGGGLLLAAAGFWLLTQVHAGAGPAVAVAGVVVFTGITPSWVLGTDLIIGSVPPEAGGSASSVSETASELGVALGVAVLGSIAAASRTQAARAIPARRPFTYGFGTAAAVSVAVAVALALLAVILLRPDR